MLRGKVRLATLPRDIRLWRVIVSVGGTWRWGCCQEM